MKLFLFICLIPFYAFSQTNCDSLYEARDQGEEKTKEALSCYESILVEATSRESQAHILNQMGYLKFFMAELFSDNKAQTLFEGMELSERSVLLFGPKYSLSDYRLLLPEEIKLLAVALYNYGLNTSRYVDMMGTFEALKRMGDIKKSMSSIMRIKEEATAHWGAHRTMGIFHTKVPSIAGGDMNLAKDFLLKALEMTIYKNGVSTYPSNNLAYSDWLYKSNKFNEACEQLNRVAALTDGDISAMDNGLYLETKTDVQKAKELFVTRQCSN
jgi:hypothetical protein